MNKDFSNALLLGRFQTLHKGHEMMIDTALRASDNVVVFIGSAQEARTSKNPFSYDERKMMLEAIYGSKIIIEPLNDIGVGNVPAWGDYVLNSYEERHHVLPDLIVSGEENRRTSWLDEKYSDEITEIFIPKTIDISASSLRAMILKKDFESWSKYVNPKLHQYFDFYENIISLSQKNTKTASL